MSCVRLVNGLHEPYQALPWATGTLTLLESIAEVPDRQVAKTGRVVYLLTSSSSILQHDSTITAEAITTIQM